MVRFHPRPPFDSPASRLRRAGGSLIASQRHVECPERAGSFARVEGQPIGCPFHFGEESAARVRAVLAAAQKAPLHEVLKGSERVVGRDAIKPLGLPEGQSKARQLEVLVSYARSEMVWRDRGSQHPSSRLSKVSAGRKVATYRATNTPCVKQLQLQRSWDSVVVERHCGPSWNCSGERAVVRGQATV
jgi:hypothetical protein